MTKIAYWERVVSFDPSLPETLFPFSTVERDALTDVADGTVIFNTDLNQIQTYVEGAWIGSMLPVGRVATLAALGALTSRPAMVYVDSATSSLDGIFAENDGGGGWFRWVADASMDGNGVTIVEPTGTPLGRYIAATTLPRRFTTTQRDAISAPPEGLIGYNSTTKKFNYYDGSDWAALGLDYGTSLATLTSNSFSGIQTFVGTALNNPVLIIGDAGGIYRSATNVFGITTSLRLLEGTAIPAGGTTGLGLKFSSTNNFGMTFGSGVPTLSAARGSIYLRSDGAPYYNTNGTTGWIAFGTVSTLSVVTANGISGSVATATTTPAITLTLGDITPTTINGNTITTGTGTLTLGAGKTFTASNSTTLTSNDGATLAIGAGGTLATAAYVATGTSGGTIPLMNGVNTWSGAQTFGVLTATTVNGNTITTGTGTLTLGASKVFTASNTMTLTATDGSTLAIGTGGTLANSAYIATGTSGGTIPLLNGTNTWSGAQIFQNATTTHGIQQTTRGAIVLANTAAGAFAATLQSSNSATVATTITLPPDAGTNGYFLQTNGSGVLTWAASVASGLSVGSTTISGGSGTRILYDNSGLLGEYTISGSGTVVAMATSPSFTTPSLGAATAVSINGNAITTGTGTLTLGTGKVLTVSNTITLAGTDSTTMTFPSTSATIARTDAANTFTGTQTIGALTATTINGNTFTTGTGVLTIAASKTLTASNTITLAGTDSTTMTFPPASANIGYLEIPQNSKSIDYTLVLADSGKHIYHPGADTSARTWTIPANASVAYPLGAALTFINDTSGGVITIAITSDTMILAGSGSTGSRTLAANGMATAIKMTTTRWIISGTGLS